VVQRPAEADGARARVGPWDESTDLARGGLEEALYQVTRDPAVSSRPRFLAQDPYWVALLNLRTAEPAVLQTLKGSSFRWRARTSLDSTTTKP